MAEEERVSLHYQATGLDSLSKASLFITGINQGLELMTRMMGMAVDAAKPFIQTGSQFERYTVQFQTLLGSLEKSEERMRSLFNFASTTPFELPDVVAAAKSLEAYGLFSERTLRAAGDAAAAFGKDFNETVLSIASASTGELERLKQFGITSARLAAEMGHEVRRETVADLREIADTVVEIFEKQATGGMLRLSQTYEGIVSNLSDAWTRFKLIVADAGPFQALKDIFGAILDTVNVLFATGTAQQFGEQIGQTIAGLMLDATIAMANVAREVFQLAAEVREFLVRAGVIEGEKTPGYTGAALSAGASPTERVIGSMIRGMGAVPRAVIGSIPGTAEYLKNAAYGGAGPEGAAPSTAVSAIDTFIENLLLRRAATVGPFPPEGSGGGGGGGLAGAAAGMAGWFDTRGGFGGYGARGGTGMPSFGEELGPSINPSEQELEKARETMAEYDKLRQAGMRGWESYYGSITKLAMKWHSGEKVRLKDLATAFGQGMRDMFSAWLSAKSQEWGIKAIEAGVEAIAAFPNMAMVGSKLKAAAGFGLLATGAGIAGGLVTAGGSAGDQSTGYSGSATPSDDSTRTYSRSQAGVKSQSVSYYISINHYGPVAYGSTDGWREMIESQIIPVIDEYQAATA